MTRTSIPIAARTSGARSRPDLARARRPSRASSRRKPATAAIEWAWRPLRRRPRARGVVPGLRAHRPRRRRSHPDIEVVFLDTQYHFAETLWYVEHVRERYDLNLTVMQPVVAARRPVARPTPTSAARAQGRAARPVRSRARQAWMTGLRRDEARTTGQRADRAPRRRPRHREGEPARDLDRRRHRGLHRATTTCPSTRSRDQGYPSIGCWPCTRPVEEGERRPRRPLGRAPTRSSAACTADPVRA